MTEEKAGSNQSKRFRHRSPNYPGIGLRTAVEKIEALYKADGLAASPRLAALKNMGFERAHGDAMRVLSALKNFGLVTESAGRIKLSQRGIDIIVRQKDDRERMKALREAAASPDVYKRLINQYEESRLPSNQTLKAELIASKKFNPNAIDGFIQGFRDTLDFAGLSDLSAASSDKNVTEVGTRVPPTDPAIVPINSGAPMPAISDQKEVCEICVPVGSNDGRVVFAHIRFNGPIKKVLLQNLRTTLDSIESSLSDE